MASDTGDRAGKVPRNETSSASMRGRILQQISVRNVSCGKAVGPVADDRRMRRLGRRGLLGDSHTDDGERVSVFKKRRNAAASLEVKRPRCTGLSRACALQSRPIQFPQCVLSKD